MLHYLRTGSGNKALVLIHGFCENNTCFQKQVLFFKDRYTLIIPDLPGFGKSATQVGISIDEMANQVKEILDKEGISRASIMGHSMGAYVALAFAELFPDRLLSLGLINSTAIADFQERKEKRLQVISFIEKNGKEPFIKNFIPTLFKDPNNKEDIDLAIAMGLESQQQGIIEAAKAMMNRPDRTEVLKQIPLPVFFAIGKFDTLIPEESLIAQAASCQWAHIAYLFDSAHMGMMEEAAKLNKELEGFLASI